MNSWAINDELQNCWWTCQTQWHPNLQGTTCVPTTTQMFLAPILKLWDHQFCFIMLCLEWIISTSWTLTLWNFIIYITKLVIYFEASIGKWKVKFTTLIYLFFNFFPKQISRLVTSQWFTKSQRPRALETQIFINEGRNQTHWNQIVPKNLFYQVPSSFSHDSWP